MGNRAKICSGENDCKGRTRCALLEMGYVEYDAYNINERSSTRYVILTEIENSSGSKFL